jgi:hypothetical protein
MGKWTEHSIFKGRSPNRQKSHEEKLNTPCHEGNANQNHVKSPLLLEWLPSRIQTTTNASEDVGKKESSYTISGNVN